MRSGKMSPIFSALFNHKILITMQDYNEYSDELEFMDEFEYEDEFEFEEEYEDEFEFEFEEEYEDEYDDEEDSEMAYELLAAESDEEVDQFLGSLLKKAVSRIKLPSFGRRRGRKRRPRPRPRPRAPFGRSPYGQQLKRNFVSSAKRFGRTMIPSLGRNLGGYFGNRWGGPRGGQYGGGAGHNIGNWVVDRLGWELEGLAPEEQELKVAKKIIKIAKAAAKKAATTTKKAPPKVIIKAALKAAAKRHLAGSGKKSTGSRYSGRWIRRGNKIVVMGAN